MNESTVNNQSTTEPTATPQIDAPQVSDPAPQEDQTDYKAEIARLKAENARQKAAMDKATSEAAALKRQLRASQSAEEQRAEEEKEKQAKREAEFEAMKKQIAVSEASKKAMAIAGDEAIADAMANAAYGAADFDELFDLFSKVLTAREKKLKLEYGKIPAPAAGDGAPTTTLKDIQGMSYKDRAAFAAKYPETYQKLIQ